MGGCTTLERMVHVHGSDAPAPQTFRYADGGSSIYYAFSLGDKTQPDSAVFFYGATGCPSWKSVMPGYASGLPAAARVFALNKRFVADRSLGLLDCGRDFNLANNPRQWAADYSEFVIAQLATMDPKPRNVVLVGVSEAATPAITVAVRHAEITHLAIIGSGGYSMRQSLATLKQKGAISFDVEEGWQKIAADPRSIENRWYGNTYRWWSDIMDADPLPELLALRIPVLVGMGERDESVPVESAYYLAARFNEEGRSNLTVKVYPAADHRLSGNGISHRAEFFRELGRLLSATTPDVGKSTP